MSKEARGEDRHSPRCVEARRRAVAHREEATRSRRARTARLSLPAARAARRLAKKSLIAERADFRVHTLAHRGAAVIHCGSR